MKKFLLRFSPGRFLTGFSSIVSVIVVMAMIVTPSHNPDMSHTEHILLPWLLGICLFFVVLFFLAISLTRDVYEKTMIVRGHDEILSELKKRTWYWRWDPIWSSGQFLSYEHVHLSFSLRYDTKAPKVRHLKYHLRFCLGGTPEQTLKFYRAYPSVDHAYAYIRSWLFDFQETHDSDLAELYNPMSHEQQAKFLRTLTAFFEPKLADSGIRFESGGFDDALNPA